MTALLLPAMWALFSGSASAAEPEPRAVTLTSAGEARPVTVEWRRIEKGATVRLDERQVTLHGRAVLPIGPEERVLRIHEPGASPRSFYVREGIVPATLDLGPPAPGGEVFGRVPTLRFRPHTIRLDGPAGRAEMRPDDDGVFARPGLPPGAYTVTPIYREDVEGPEARIVVRERQTTELLPLDLAEVGAVRLDFTSLCAERDLSLRLDGPGHPKGLTREIRFQCLLDLVGLAPGAWRAAVTRGGARNEPRASAEFAVSGGETTDVTFEPVVRVMGTVTAGGAPASGLRVVFERGMGRWSVATDVRGDYQALLGLPGEYAVSVLASRDLPSRSFGRTFAPGDHREDIELGVCSIEVSVTAEAGTRLEDEVELALFEANGRRLSGRFDLREGRALFTGLDYGDYTVTAVTASGLRSRNHARAELTAEAPDAQVALEMGRGRGVVKVVGAGGVPLPGARVAAGQAALTEREPGSFDLAGVPRGERLVAHAPEHVPVCRRLDAPAGSSDFVIRLPVGDELFTLELPAGTSWQDALVALEVSNCPLAIDDLEPQVRTEDHAVTVVLRLPRGVFHIALDGTLHRASAPGHLQIP